MYFILWDLKAYLFLTIRGTLLYCLLFESICRFRIVTRIKPFTMKPYVICVDAGSTCSSLVYTS
jgi:hypothetical protein